MVLHQNGLLSFSNPSYHLDDAVNCNTEPTSDELYDELLYQEIDSVCNFKQQRSSAKNRRNYANLDIGSMGIDISNEAKHSLGGATDEADTNRNTSSTSSARGPMGASCDVTDNEKIGVGVSGGGGCGGGGAGSVGQTANSFLDYYINVDAWSQHSSNRPDLIENIDATNSFCLLDGQQSERSPDSNSNELGGSCCMELNSPDSMDTAPTEDVPLIPHVPGQLNNDLYAVLVKRNKSGAGGSSDGACLPPCATAGTTAITNSSKPTTPLGDGKDTDTCSGTSLLLPDALPPGWERHEDNDGPYYWHIKSGTIQREIPLHLHSSYKEIKKSISKEIITSNSGLCTAPLTVALPPPADSGLVKDSYKRKSYPRIEHDNNDKPIRFAVRSLGWVEIAEEDLTPERSSKAVNKCIVDLSLGRNDILDVVGRWGDGKELFMDLDDNSLKLVDPENLTVLNTQPIHTIRVWGVGRDNGRERDFAYVARDRVTRKHMCHVFRCDTPARTIANTLRDICKKIMIERSLVQNLGKSIDLNKNGGGGGGGAGSALAAARFGLTRPTNLPTEHRRLQSRGTVTAYSAQSFPTPMEEPKKVLKVHYLGSVKVNKPTGMEVLNMAIDHMTSTLPMDKWQFVNVAVAPSTITISEPGEDGKLVAECRVRFLSFLGIGRNVKHCGFVVHTAQDQFVAHVFHCEPSSGALCKTIEAACKLRYQKCLDAHPPGSDKRYGDSHGGKSISAAFKNVLGSLTGRRPKTGNKS